MAPLGSLSSSNSTPRYPALCVAWQGRWGNHVYQTMFILSAAARHPTLVPYLEPFTGSELLQMTDRYPRGCPQPGRDGQRRPSKWNVDWGEWFDLDPLQGAKAGEEHVVVYEGYFQYNHSGYLPYRPLLQLHMRPKPVIEALLEAVWFNFLLSLPDDVLVVGVHIRHGDYAEKDCHPYCRVPVPWYIHWLRQIRADPAVVDASGRRPLQAAWEAQRANKEAARLRYRQPSNAVDFFASLPASTLCEGPNTSTSTSTSTSTLSSVRVCLLLATDDVAAVTAEFRAAGEAVTSPADVVRAAPSQAALSGEVTDFFVDWWMLGQCSLVATSHSSFSYTAALFNSYQERGSYWRPDPVLKGISSFLPWHSQYKDTAFDGVLR